MISTALKKAEQTLTCPRCIPQVPPLCQAPASATLPLPQWPHGQGLASAPTPLTAALHPLSSIAIPHAGVPLAGSSAAHALDVKMADTSAAAAAGRLQLNASARQLLERQQQQLQAAMFLSLAGHRDAMIHPAPAQGDRQGALGGIDPSGLALLRIQDPNQISMQPGPWLASAPFSTGTGVIQDQLTTALLQHMRAQQLGMAGSLPGGISIPMLASPPAPAQALAAPAAPPSSMPQTSQGGGGEK